MSGDVDEVGQSIIDQALTEYMAVADHWDDLWEQTKQGIGTAIKEFVAGNAIDFMQRKGIPSGLGNQDAIFHLYVSADLVYEYYTELTTEIHFPTVGTSAEALDAAMLGAERMGNLKEHPWVPGFLNTPDPTDMAIDQWNNAIGRQIGKYAVENGLTKAEMEALLYEAYKEDLIIKNEDDSRIGSNPNWTVSPEFAQEAMQHCFSGMTIIKIDADQSKPISEICVGDEVAAFSPRGGKGHVGLARARVSKVFRGVTSEWLKLVPLDDERSNVIPVGTIVVCSDDVVDETATYVTPGHNFLNEFNAFEPIESITRRGGMIVCEDGNLRRMSAERLVYSEATAHLFEQAEITRYATGPNGTALEPYVERDWATYNFEVEKYHTYIANGWRVHNDSRVYIDAAGAIGQAFGSQLGMLLTEGENQFVQLAVGTGLGTLTRNLAEVITDFGYHAFTGDLDQIDALRELGDVPQDLLNATLGTVSSFLVAQLGEELGLEGFGAELFNVTAGTYAGSVLDQVIALDGNFSAVDWLAPFEAAIPGALGMRVGPAVMQRPGRGCSQWQWSFMRCAQMQWRRRWIPVRGSG